MRADTTADDVSQFAELPDGSSGGDRSWNPYVCIGDSCEFHASNP